MEQIIWAALITVGVFIAVIFIARQLSSDNASSKHSKRIMSQLYEQQSEIEQQNLMDNTSILKSNASGIGQLLLVLPKGEQMYDLILKAGMGDRINGFVFFCIALFFFLLIVLNQLVGGFFTALLLAAVLTILLPRFYLKRRINKRNEAFINQFPDAVDMIVRSVKSGHPLNTALRMIAENMDPPVSVEFKKLVDEIAFGRSTVEALTRMSKRIDEPDLQFFVVILSVQQETGGNLAEVLSNLSGIIRKRKQLRLKIKAMTSEGRATAYVLGGLPLVVFGAIHVTSPDYLTPLFETDTGQIILFTAVGLVALAAFIVRNMLQIDI